MANDVRWGWYVAGALGRWRRCVLLSSGFSHCGTGVGLTPVSGLMPCSSLDQKAIVLRIILSFLFYFLTVPLVPLHLDGFCLAHHCPVCPLETRWSTPLWMIRASFDLKWLRCGFALRALRTLDHHG